MTVQELKVEKLARIVEIISHQECEQRAFMQGGEKDECVNVYPDDEDWCLVCIARRDLAAYRESE
jgi:hypothetical protein